MTKHKLRPETEKAFEDFFEKLMVIDMPGLLNPGVPDWLKDNVRKDYTKKIRPFIKQFIATVEAEAEERGRSEAIRKAKLFCLGSVTSLGYGLKWKDYEVKLLTNSLNDGLDLISEGKYENTR